MFYVLFSFSIIIAALIGGVRFTKIDPAFYPFVFLTWLASLNEILSFVFGKYGITTNLNNNIYVLLEAWLLVWQAKRWNVFGKAVILYRALLAVITVVWLYQVFSAGINVMLYGYRIFYAVLMLFIFIGYNNKLLFEYFRPVIRSSAFLISTGLMFFFTFKILVELYWWLGVNNSDRFLFGVYNVIVFINLFVNILYTIAMLWIPTKPKYTTFS